MIMTIVEKMGMNVIVRRDNTVQCVVLEVSCRLASLISWQDGSPARRGGACLPSFRLQASGVCRPPIKIHTGRQGETTFNESGLEVSKGQVVLF